MDARKSEMKYKCNCAKQSHTHLLLDPLPSHREGTSVQSSNIHRPRQSNGSHAHPLNLANETCPSEPMEAQQLAAHALAKSDEAVSSPAAAVHTAAATAIMIKITMNNWVKTTSMLNRCTTVYRGGSGGRRRVPPRPAMVPLRQTLQAEDPNSVGGPSKAGVAGAAEVKDLDLEVPSAGSDATGGAHHPYQAPAATPRVARTIRYPFVLPAVRRSSETSTLSDLKTRERSTGRSGASSLRSAANRGAGVRTSSSSPLEGLGRRPLAPALPPARALAGCLAFFLPLRELGLVQTLLLFFFLDFLLGGGGGARAMCFMAPPNGLAPSSSGGAATAEASASEASAASAASEKGVSGSAEAEAGVSGRFGVSAADGVSSDMGVSADAGVERGRGWGGRRIVGGGGFGFGLRNREREEKRWTRCSREWKR
uniref:Uncharacterized protein n=1 Tax=Oryza barthii TaxID=65489 RepID=A0A0D3HI49_9ORYZ